MDSPAHRFVASIDIARASEVEGAVAPRRMRAATGDILSRLADACDPTTPAGLRSRALILVGFDAALGSAELVSLDHEHLTRTLDGISLSLPRSKSDQLARGAFVAVAARAGSPWCPVVALERWIEASGRGTGALFVGACRGPLLPGIPVTRLSTRAVARVVRATAAAAGLATDEVNEFSGHSLRPGQITTALDGGAAPEDVMRNARHGSPRSTLLYREVADAVGRQPRAAIGPPDSVVADGAVPGAGGGHGLDDARGVGAR